MKLGAWIAGIAACTLPNQSNSFSMSMESIHQNKKRIVILGGAGRIGTAVATHLLRENEQCQVVLVGRRSSQAEAAIQEVLDDSKADPYRLSYSLLDNIWKESSDFQELVDSTDCLIHTAGPYLDEKPIPLQLAIKSKRCQAYVDLSDPLPFLEESLLFADDAKSSNLTALMAAGAFPGMSNVLAKEASAALGDDDRVEDIRFNYFTAGLGGSGVVNLYITNLGFGEPMVQYNGGRLRKFMELSGVLLGQIDFFLPHLKDHAGNERAKQRVGRKTLFAWPFPEAATVARDVEASGHSYAAMGTAPDIWNGMLGLLVKLVPRPLWKDTRFSKFMADFSQPLVFATDALLQQSGTGELHAMRVDVTSTAAAGSSEKSKGVSIVQGHDSFRQCVGQSCAEFALDILEHPRPGAYLPEQFYDDSQDRTRIIKKLTNTPGTFCYTGAVLYESAPDPPTNFHEAIMEASKSVVPDYFE